VGYDKPPPPPCLLNEGNTLWRHGRCSVNQFLIRFEMETEPRSHRRLMLRLLRNAATPWCVDQTSGLRVPTVMENLEKSWNFKSSYLQAWKSHGRKKNHKRFGKVMEMCYFHMFDEKNKNLNKY